MGFKDVIEKVAYGVDATGVAVLAIGIVAACVRYLWKLHKGEGESYRLFRQEVGKGILLGLEFLVAADIIRTVAIHPTLRSVSVLGLIVLIRTFLSMALEVELEGQWPWRRAKS